jgi:hypothetical protein
MYQKTKIGRNDKCLCGSGKKYKACCIEKMMPSKYNMGQSVSSDAMMMALTKFMDKFKDRVFIDISDDLSAATYRDYQVKNMTTNVVMLAEKKQSNEDVFESRCGNSPADVILMYHGSYRLFSMNALINRPDELFASVSTLLSQ